MRLLTTLATVGSILLIGLATLQQQSTHAAAVTNTTRANRTVSTVDAVLGAGTRALGITIPPLLMAAFVAAALGLLVAVGGGGR